MNEPELGAGSDSGMAFNPFPSSIWTRRDSNPQPLDCESSSLTTRPDLRPELKKKTYFSSHLTLTQFSVPRPTADAPPEIE